LGRGSTRNPFGTLPSPRPPIIMRNNVNVFRHDRIELRLESSTAPDAPTPTSRTGRHCFSRENVARKDWH
jgi:hypothetical protein